MTSDQDKTSFTLANHGFVRRLAVRWATVPDLVDDIVQQVFLEVMEKWETWDRSTDMKPLLVVVTKRVALRLWRQRAKTLPAALCEIAESIQRLAEENSELTDVSRHEEQLETLRQCLDKLPARSRSVIEMYYFEEFSAKRLAEKTGVKPGAVWTAVCRIREKLRNCMETTMQREAHDPAHA